MTHTFKIKETPKTKSLIELLSTLAYVEHIEDPHRTLTEKEMIARVKKAEKGKKIPYNEFVKITEVWKGKVKKP
jgi:HEPN domain-containing protein